MNRIFLVRQLRPEGLAGFRKLERPLTGGVLVWSMFTNN